jgi:hypothetical protein
MAPRRSLSWSSDTATTRGTCPRSRRQIL